jgi:hypothetical protein
MYVGDGENMISNPNYEWSKLMDFLGLQKEHFDFFVPEEKGFPCLNTPIRHCLNDAKGLKIQAAFFTIGRYFAKNASARNLPS